MKEKINPRICGIICEAKGEEGEKKYNDVIKLNADAVTMQPSLPS